MSEKQNGWLDAMETYRAMISYGDSFWRNIGVACFNMHSKPTKPEYIQKLRDAFPYEFQRFRQIALNAKRNQEWASHREIDYAYYLLYDKGAETQEDAALAWQIVDDYWNKRDELNIDGDLLYKLRQMANDLAYRFPSRIEKPETDYTEQNHVL